MKIWKKNLIAAAVLITVCAGIYINWLYSEDAATSDLTDTIAVDKVMSDDMLVLSEDAQAISSGEAVDTTSQDYFAAVRLSRQEARDSAVNLIQEAMAYSDGSKASESAGDLEDIVQTALSEALSPHSRRSPKRSQGVYLMEHIACPGLLVECGFLSNPAEEKKLSSAEYQKKLAAIMAASLAKSVFGHL